MEPDGGPREIEQTVLSVVTEVLGTDRVGVQDHLFDLGVSSAMITKIHRILRTELDLDFPLVMLLEGPNIRRVAERLTAFRQDGSTGDESTVGNAFDRGRKKRAAMLARSRRRRG